MRTRQVLTVLSALVLAAGCKQNDTPKVDDALNSDLSLASQNRPYTAADSVSAAERARAAAAANAPAAPAPVRTRTVVHHVYQSSGSSSGSSAGTSSSASRGPIDHVEKNPGRDAAIGAGAGAILGAATSKDKLKGGVIGAAAGGILGAVIGNNVDKKKVPNH